MKSYVVFIALVVVLALVGSAFATYPATGLAYVPQQQLLGYDAFGRPVFSLATVQYVPQFNPVYAPQFTPAPYFAPATFFPARVLFPSRTIGFFGGGRTVIISP